MTHVSPKSKRIPLVTQLLSARYPGAPDLHAYWQSLVSGTSSIQEIPPSRWDWREHFEADPSEAVARGSG